MTIAIDLFLMKKNDNGRDYNLGKEETIVVNSLDGLKNKIKPFKDTFRGDNGKYVCYYHFDLNYDKSSSDIESIEDEIDDILYG